LKNDSYPTNLVNGTVGSYTAGMATTDIAEVSVPIHQQANPQKRSTRWLHALPRDCVGAGGIILLSSTYNGALTTYLAAIKSRTMIATRLVGQASNWQFLPITAQQVGYGTVRKVGRPFSLRRGRRMIR
jgi:hypothetical protein